MRKLIVIMAYLSLLVIIPQRSSCQTIKVMTYNILNANPRTDKYDWKYRKAEMIKQLVYYHPDFLGMQEVLKIQLQDISDGLGYCGYIGVGREDGKEKGEFVPILYDTSKFDLIRKDNFWLSEQPDKVSLGWDAACIRICTYGLFKEKQSGKQIYVFNTHFDHQGINARMMSSKLILKKIEEYTSDNSSIILMGDLNCSPESDPIEILKKKLVFDEEISPDGFYGPDGTFNGFNDESIVIEKIDYIFVKNLSVLNYRHIEDRIKNNGYISDHYPVLTELKMK